MLATAGLSLIGQSHLYLSSFLLQGEGIYWFGWCFSLTIFTFFLAFTVLFHFLLPVGVHLEVFFFLGHGRFVQCFYHIAFHHERGDFIFEVGLPNVHSRVHAFDSFLDNSKNYHIEF